jgi:hypothetical protein
VRHVAPLLVLILFCATGAASVFVRTPGELRLAGEVDFPPGGRFPLRTGPRFGGISGLAAISGGRELIAISDDRERPHAYRFSVAVHNRRFAVTPIETIRLASDPRAPAVLDPEGIAVLPNGHLLVASEGLGDKEPRIPPGILEYTRRGDFVRQLVVRPRYIPTPTGPLTSGVRSNLAFESLTLTPDGTCLFTATETAIVQDGDAAGFEHGTRARLLEYVKFRGTFVPAREFAYPIDAMKPVAFAAGLKVVGLVDLVALSESELLSLERTYIENPTDKEESVNRIAIFRVSLAGATDVSAVESLATSNAVPVTKTLLLDLSKVNGLSEKLARLDNFEGMTFGPRLANGHQSLIIVSDDNFSDRQITSFLLFEVEP